MLSSDGDEDVVHLGSHGLVSSLDTRDQLRNDIEPRDDGNGGNQFVHSCIDDGGGRR